ncbi:Mif2/CENP-C like-domain-containing protein [Poronia punctata]|nr:Mif2/CENP-C like-domain-containing protein [Poronia punctata]
MAPRGQTARRQTQSTNEHVYSLGVVGRRTGIELPESNVRDEHGFEKMDIFSSPESDVKAAPSSRKPHPTSTREDNPSDQDEQDMEIDDGSEIGPGTMLKLQQGRPSLPRGRSPIKTHLGSPARQNPHLPPTSSPIRGEVVPAPEPSSDRVVARKLNFSKSASSASSSQAKRPQANAQSKGSAAKGRSEKLTNGHSQSSRHHEEPTRQLDISPEAEDEEEDEEEEDAMELIDTAGHDDEIPEPEEFEQEEQDEEEEEEEEAPVVQKLKSANKSKPPGRRGRKPKTVVDEEQEDKVDAPVPEVSIEENEVDEEPVKKRRGRPKAASKPKEDEPDPVPEPEPEPESEPEPVPDPTPPKASKRGRPAKAPTDNVEDEARGAKRQKILNKPSKAEQSSSSRSVVEREKGKPGRKRKSSGVGAESPMIQRGPPLPKSRGLVTVRREEITALKTTRSGRTSFKPLEWWKGEHVEYDEDAEKVFVDSGNRHFKMPTVKGIVRTEEAQHEATHKRRGRAAGRKPGRPKPSTIIEEEAEVEREDWEYEEGRLEGDVIVWRPEHEFEPPLDEDQVEVEPVELAISENAIQLKDIKDATFKFAKTLSLPFFASGIVELPPNSQKRTKNSRKMHLAFFVHSGNVQVKVGQTEFGIAKGGMFFVPRGNNYSLRNETDRTSRLFFSQGCEMLAEPIYEEEGGEGYPGTAKA